MTARGASSAPLTWPTPPRLLQCPPCNAAALAQGVAVFHLKLFQCTFLQIVIFHFTRFCDASQTASAGHGLTWQTDQGLKARFFAAQAAAPASAGCVPAGRGRQWRLRQQPLTEGAASRGGWHQRAGPLPAPCARFAPAPLPHVLRSPRLLLLPSSPQKLLALLRRHLHPLPSCPVCQPGLLHLLLHQFR